MSSDPSSLDLLRGTLDLLILKSLSWGPQHGYGVASWIGRTTDEALLVEEGALYPALHRLERRGWIESRWGLSDNNRRAKYYRLTAPGRRRLQSEVVTWERYAQAVGRVLAAEAPG